MRMLFCLGLVGLVALPASAAIVVDGVKDNRYGAALAVQETPTSFGDNQSELNAAYAKIWGGKLHLMLTGNMEANFNKLNIFIDSVDGGQNVFNAVTNNDGSDNMNGLTFDTGFEADYHMIFRRGFDGFSGFDSGKIDVNHANLATDEFAFHQDVISSPDNQIPGAGIEGADPTDPGPGQGGSLLHNPIGVGYDNSNTAGVIGCNDGGSDCGAPDQTAAALAVTTGIELSIDLADIGIVDPVAGQTILVSAVVTSGDHTFASNQVLGSAPAGQTHLQDLSNVNYNNLDGDQFFTVTIEQAEIPEPTSLVLVLLGLASAAVCSRRR